MCSHLQATVNIWIGLLSRLVRDKEPALVFKVLVTKKKKSFIKLIQNVIVIKPFFLSLFVTDTPAEKARAFVPGKSLQPSLNFENYNSLP